VSAVANEHRVASIEDPEQLQALAHPLRLRILEALRAPASAAAVARTIDASRQNVNYHLKELERVGLVSKVGERRARNFIETLFQASATAYVVSPRAAWGDERRMRAVADQVSLERLVELGEELSRDAAILLDRAAFDGEEIASASVDVEVMLADEEQRAAFIDEYLAAVTPIARRYGQRDGSRYRLRLAVYPYPHATTTREDEEHE
jgi:DNA-binding transcriptional ArsR family regulator